MIELGKYEKMAMEGKFNYNESRISPKTQIQQDKRKNLPPLETWLNSNKSVKDLMEMGYLYEEILFGEMYGQ